MTLHTTRLYQLLTAVAFTLGLTACGGSNTKEEPVTYTIAADTDSLNFVHYEGETLSDKRVVTIDYSGEGLLVGFAPDAPVASWLSFETKAVDGDTTELIIDLKNTQFIAKNDLTTTIRVSTGNLAESKLVYQDIPVSLKIWQLRSSASNISFSSKFNADNVPAVDIDIAAEGTEWTLSSDVEWLVTDITQGTGDAEINISVDPTKVEHWGQFTGNMIFTEASTGDTRSFPVTYAVDAYRLWSSDSSIALVSAGQLSATEQVVRIFSNSPDAISWQATSDKTWLTVSGDTNTNTLTLTASDNGLSSGLHTATVTVSPTTDNAAEAGTINIAFYKQTNTPIDKSLTLTDLTLTDLVMDPLRPYVYYVKGNELLVYNYYSGDLVTQKETPVTGGTIESLVTHPDGDLLLLNVTPTDKATDSNRDTLVTFSTADLSFDIVDESSLQDPLLYNPKAYVKLEGLTYVVSAALEFADTTFNRQYWDVENAFIFNQIRQPADQSSFYVLNGQLSLYRYIANVNQFFDKGIATARTHTLQFSQEVDSLIFDFNVDLADTNIYVASTDTEWLTFDGLNFADQTSLHGTTDFKTFDTAQVDSGDVFFLRVDAELNYLLARYDNHQQLINTQLLDNETPTKFAISPNGLRIISQQTNEGETKITFRVVE